MTDARSLDREDLDDDPIVQFQQWYAEATEAGEAEPDAMSLATATPDGIPSVRWVLLKGVSHDGFVFYTNVRSPKSAELASNPRAGLGFRWATMNRQVRVTGPVQPVTEDEADAYFATRARGSQLGAWASEQSAVLLDRATLEERTAEVDQRFAGKDVPRPPWWSGWRVRPEVIEFWQGRADRLHDRLRYRDEGGLWVIERLYP